MTGTTGYDRSATAASASSNSRRDPTRAPFLASPGLSEERSDHLASRVEQAAQSARGTSPQRLAVPYATDAPFFAQLGIPTVIFGPGSIDQAHTADEWITVEQLHQAVEVYYEIAARGIQG